MRADGLNPGSCIAACGASIRMPPLLFDHLLERLEHAAGTPKPPAS